MVLLTQEQLLGQHEQHLVDCANGHRLQPQAASAFDDLRKAAQAEGFELAIASSFRSFERQRQIWNAKASGERAVHDTSGCAVDMACLSPVEKMHAILRYSALPGASRHHWGTDLDVFDAAAVPSGYTVQLTPEEVAPGGVFDAMHCWLDERIAQGGSFGFYRPYGSDRGGVAPERWHLSFAPLSQAYAKQLSPEMLQLSWTCLPERESLLLLEPVTAALTEVFDRYVAVPDDGWVGK